MKCFIIVFSFIVSFVLLDGKQFRCDYNYVDDVEAYVKLHRIPANWNEARLRCQFEGATLVSPTSDKIRNTMRSMMFKENLGDTGVYTGIHATFSRGDFYTIEGVPLSRIPHVWAEGEPDNYKDNEKCILFTVNGTIADIRCSEPYPYICFKKRTSFLANTICGTTDHEYNLDSRTGSCYKFHKTPRSWSRAYMVCSAEGGHLAIVNSETESKVLKELFEKNPGNSMLGNFWKDIAFVGFHDWTEHGEWRTIHGETIHEAGFTVFEPNQPDNATTGEFCGSIFRSGKLNDVWCENRYAFICEKSPGSMCAEDP